MIFTHFGFLAGWLWCVLMGIYGEPYMANIGALFLIFTHLYRMKVKNTRFYLQDLVLMLFIIPLGTLLETFFIQTNLIKYVNAGHFLPPFRIVCLYALFSFWYNRALNIKKSFLATFIIGFMIALFHYSALEYLGGIRYHYSLFSTLITEGMIWGLFLCLLAKISNSIETAVGATLADCNSDKPIKLLYDDECPICHKEICILQKKDKHNKVKFVDISSTAYLPIEHQNIDYQKAMSEIHAIDYQGNMLVGIPAFAAIYARCQFLVLSTLMRLPFIESLLKPLYRLFAKNRLWLTGRSNATKNRR